MRELTKADWLALPWLEEFLAQHEYALFMLAHYVAMGYSMYEPIYRHAEHRVSSWDDVYHKLWRSLDTKWRSAHDTECEKPTIAALAEAAFELGFIQEAMELKQCLQ